MGMRRGGGMEGLPSSTYGAAATVTSQYIKDTVFCFEDDMSMASFS